MKKVVSGLVMVIGYFAIYLGLSQLMIPVLAEPILKLFPEPGVGSVVYQILFAVLAALFLILLSTKDIFEGMKAFGKNIERNIVKILIYIGLMFVLLVVVNLTLMSLGLLEVSANQEVINELFQSSPALMFIFAGVLAPITEELTFRLGIRRMIKNKYLFMVISTFAFAYIHVMNAGDIINIFPYLVLGGVLSYVLIKENDNIFIPIVVHMIWNMLTFLLQSIA